VRSTPAWGVWAQQMSTLRQQLEPARGRTANRHALDDCHDISLRRRLTRLSCCCSGKIEEHGDMRMWSLAVVAAASLVCACDAQPDRASENVADRAEVTFAANLDSSVQASSNKSAPGEQSTAESSLTPAQANAVRSAEQYLSMTGFSRQGLIDQLSSDAGEGYSVSDATAAIDSLSVDWNENAARSARQYLQMTGFSCKGLIEQLSSSAGDKYTAAQATYGARQAGAC
jgi:hypothetical protein